MQTTDPINDVTPPIELETGPNPTACVIWLHGLGADGSDFEPIVPELRLPRNLAVRFVFPHAPYRPVTINGGYIMRAWYDIEMTDSGFNQKVSHIRESEAVINALVEEQIARGIPSTRIVLADSPAMADAARTMLFGWYEVLTQVATEAAEQLGGLGPFEPAETAIRPPPWPPFSTAAPPPPEPRCCGFSMTP